MVFNNGFIVQWGIIPRPTDFRITCTFPVSFNGTDNYKCVPTASLKAEDFVSSILGISSRSASTMTFNTNREISPSGFYIATGF